MSDAVFDKFTTYNIISIHAPTGGATCAVLEYLCLYSFQSTLPQGERPILTFDTSDQSKFQSTLSQGERRKAVGWLNKKLDISIHAPTGGATIFFVSMVSVLYNFNPRSHRGSDIRILGLCCLLKHFNPRSHRGERHRAGILSFHHNYFNPHSHRGSDNKACNDCYK